MEDEVRAPTYTDAELQAAQTNIEIALTKLRRLLEDEQNPDLRHRVRGVVIKLDDSLSALRRV
jgi:hypothetical protein